MTKSYDVSTLLGMARIPADRFHVFLSELPALIPHVRFVIELGEAHGATDEQLMESIKRSTWVDDDLGNVDINIKGVTPDGKQVFDANIHENIHTGGRTSSFNPLPHNGIEP